MLFGSTITKDIIRDENKLVEQFYIFLNNYVNKKLIYENEQTKQDCIQETIMVLLKKARLLTDEQVEKLNLERYFYNRANSYVSSIFLGKLKRYRSRVVSVDSYNNLDIKNSNEDILSVMREPEDFKTQRYVRENILERVINSFNLDKKTVVIVDNMVRYALESIGITSCPDEEILSNKLLEPLVLAIVDEYILEIITNER